MLREGPYHLESVRACFMSCLEMYVHSWALSSDQQVPCLVECLTSQLCRHHTA